MVSVCLLSDFKNLPWEKGSRGADPACCADEEGVRRKERRGAPSHPDMTDEK